MKKQKLVVVILGVLSLSVLILAIYQFQSRKPTAIEISSISPKKPLVGETVRVAYKVSGGANDFSIVVLPDTQHYSDAYPEFYFDQTQWIVDNEHTENIVFVSHLGDIVQNNDYFEDEWKVADAAMDKLDGIVPYGILPGNHDMQSGGAAQFYTHYFPASRFSENEWWGSSFNDNKNNYQLLLLGDENYIIVHLQYCPPDSAIEWVNEVLSNYSNHKAIIATHSYLLTDGHRVGHCQIKSDGDNSGFDIWRKVVRQNKNIFLVLSGHIPGVFHRVDEVDGRTVYQLLSDYTNMENGGNGFLRIMRFQPNLDNIQVTTFSPSLDAYLTDSLNQFDLPFDMIGGKIPSGKITISNGVDSCSASVEAGNCELTITDDSELEFYATYSGDINFKRSVSE